MCCATVWTRKNERRPTSYVDSFDGSSISSTKEKKETRSNHESSVAAKMLCVFVVVGGLEIHHDRQSNFGPPSEYIEIIGADRIKTCRSFRVLNGRNIGKRGAHVARCRTPERRRGLQLSCQKHFVLIELRNLPIRATHESVHILILTKLESQLLANLMIMLQRHHSPVPLINSCSSNCCSWHLKLFDLSTCLRSWCDFSY